LRWYEHTPAGKVQPLGQRAEDLQLPNFHLLQEKLKVNKKKKRKLGLPLSFRE
jgi:hypothetical protein